VVLALALLYLLPALPGMQHSSLRRFLPDASINFGLDLVGGIHLTLGVEVDKALENSLARMGADIRTIARGGNILTLRPRLLPGGEKVEITLAKADQKAAFEEVLAKNFPDLRFDAPQAAEEGRLRYVGSLTDLARDHMAKFALAQAVTTIRNRIDQFGVSEPDIRERPADHSIVIQLPGIRDADRAIKIVGQTAHLEFRIVHDDVDPARVAKGILPPGTELLPMVGKDGGEGAPILVDKEATLTGEYITDASPATDQRTHEWHVRMSFDNRGAALFDRITGDNTGKRMAIVLDGKVRSAPTIQERISGGTASITGRFSAQEAQDLSLVLRAGSLPAPVHIMEERTVGPSLGQESIDKGVRAALIGGALVVLFMVVYYGVSGLIADAMLALDVVLILAGMAAFGATLTLPGIAGIVLTLGMAVDANVLIFERIREELRRSVTPIAAIRAGFSRATIAITDSNLTTVIAAVVLYQFGTGPIRGFAVTLTLGIAASMFTAIFVSHIIYDMWMGKKGRKLSI
jgi:preprotein translocase subunit SecD